MTLAEEIKIAKENNYKRIWLVTDNYSMLCADMFLDQSDQWKNSNIAPYVVEEYANEEVMSKMTHPYYDDTLILLVKYKTELQSKACERCIQDAEKNERRQKLWETITRF